MIIIDQGETDGRTLLPEIKGARVCPILEAETGADLAISPLEMPATTKTLLLKHRDAGALFVQGKWSFDDLSASVMDGRLMGSIARMLAFEIPSACRVLLYTGPIPVLGSAEWGALTKYQDRGGRVETPLPSYNDIPRWCAMKERHVKEYSGRPLSWIFTEAETPVDNGMLQIPMEVAKNDPRRAIIQCPGIGQELANRWWEAVRLSLPATATLFDLLAWMSWEKPDEAGIPKVPGYAEGKRLAFRKWLGLTPGHNLGLKGAENE